MATAGRGRQAVRAALGAPLVDDRLRAAGGLGGRGVEESDPLLRGEIHHRDRSGLVDFSAEGHATKADGARGGECAGVRQEEKCAAAEVLLRSVAAVDG